MLPSAVKSQKRYQRLIWFVVKDNARKRFNVNGPLPLYMDYYWTHAVARAQEAGRDITCTCIRVPSAPTKEEIITEFEKMGFRYVEEEIVHLSDPISGADSASLLESR